MVESHTDMARAAIESSFLLQRSSYAGRIAFRRDMDQSRRAIAASREILKRFREHHRVSAFDADILRSAFRDLVNETGAPESQWRELATSLAHEFTGERIEADLVDWIIRK